MGCNTCYTEPDVYNWFGDDCLLTNIFYKEAEANIILDRARILGNTKKRQFFKKNLEKENKRRYIDNDIK